MSEILKPVNRHWPSDLFFGLVTTFFGGTFIAVVAVIAKHVGWLILIVFPIAVFVLASGWVVRRLFGIDTSRW